jgi:hypothetical protein
MAQTTVPDEHDTLTRDPSTGVETSDTREPGPPARRSRTAILSWVGVGAALAAAVAFVVAVVVSGDDTSERPAVAPADIVGSDQHLANQANDIADRTLDVTGSDQHLTNQANDIADRTLDVTGSDQHLVNQANDIADRAG